MKERPILFSGPLVRALLAGTKTQTRRLVKKPPGWWSAWLNGMTGQYEPSGYTQVRPSRDGLFIQSTTPGELIPPKASPYGVPGDRLWVRETWRTFEREEDGIDGIRLAADDAFLPIANDAHAADLWVQEHANGKHGDNWRPSIYMRRWASRITLEVTAIRAERLQSISEEDAKAEGVTTDAQQGKLNGKPATLYPMTHRQAFTWLWDRINGKRASWASNPWCWVIEFQRVDARKE